MATTLFRGPVLQGKFNEAGLTGYNLEKKTAAYAVLIADSGKTFASGADSITFTLPAIAANEGSVFTFVNTGQDSSNGIVVTGAAGTEYITYKGVVNQITLTNTKATSKVGDYVKIGGQLAGSTWTVLDIQGVWA